ncbi:MAG: class I SAM-dependent methyltransferase [Thermodesulfobacteriota bacterium]
MKQDPENVTITQLLKVPGLRGGNVLEIGCGDGRITSELSSHVNRLVGLDPDPEALEKARSRVPGAEFQTGSGEQLRFPERCFDAVLFTLSLHHQDPRAALRKAAEVIRDNGRILVLEPVAGSEVERVCRPLNDERHAYLDSLYVLLEGPWTIQCMEFFGVRWIFENQRELIEWVFAYYRKPFHEKLAARIIKPLGKKRANRPLFIEDRLMLVVLKKPGHATSGIL